MEKRIDQPRVSMIQHVAGELYGDAAPEFLTALYECLESWRTTAPRVRAAKGFSEQDTLLITYGDQFTTTEISPLEELEQFLDTYLRHSFSWIHILPFFPATSDDGFAVSDYRTVDPAIGTWEPVQRMAKTFHMTYDLVLNHTSASHRWFHKFLANEEPWNRFYHTRPETYDWSEVVRPRTHPLLSPFTRTDGSPVHVWTTFSTDQVDLNYENPQVMVEMIDTLLFYIAQGASMIRLDAVAYLWKEAGTKCIHHPKTHKAVQLFRAVVDYIGLHTRILTETNVPHDENVSYFGRGDNEAHMVYNFALPPLTLQAFTAETAEHLTRWASTLPTESRDTTFLNFLASHDGIGVTPAAGWLSPEELDQLVTTVRERGGHVSWKTTPTGEIPYELNINWLSAIAGPDLPEELRIRIHLSSHAIMIALAGVPGVYIHSLLGSQNWSAGVALQGHNRAINRQRLQLSEIQEDLENPRSLRGRIFNGMRQLLGVRRREPCLSPTARQQIIHAGPKVFAILRTHQNRALLCLTNTSSQPVTSTPVGVATQPQMRDLLSGKTVSTGRGGVIELAPWETLWLEASR